MVKNIVVVSCLLIAACATQAPSQPLSREQRIQNAVAAEYRAGGDGEATYEKLHLQVCLQDAVALSSAARSAAIAQCRADWPVKPDVMISNR